MSVFTELGWVEIVDVDGRRGLWIRVTDGSFEIRAGREGDDHHVEFHVGAMISAEQVAAVRACVETIEWAREMTPPLSDRLAAARQAHAEKTCDCEAREYGGASICAVVRGVLDELAEPRENGK